MNTKQAKTILESLVQGIDPETRERFLHDAVLDKPNVIRALLVSVAAFDLVAQRDARESAGPANIGKVGLKRRNNSSSRGFRVVRRCPISPRHTGAPSEQSSRDSKRRV